mgnify:CR=1 FL=1
MRRLSHMQMKDEAYLLIMQKGHFSSHENFFLKVDLLIELCLRNNFLIQHLWWPQLSFMLFFTIDNESLTGKFAIFPKWARNFITFSVLKTVILSPGDCCIIFTVNQGEKNIETSAPWNFSFLITSQVIASYG